MCAYLSLSDAISSQTTTRLCPWDADGRDYGMTDETWLTRQELAERWKMPPTSLNQWASQGKGPKYARFGRHCRYRLSDVIDWENLQFINGGDAA